MIRSKGSCTIPKLLELRHHQHQRASSTQKRPFIWSGFIIDPPRKTIYVISPPHHHIGFHKNKMLRAIMGLYNFRFWSDGGTCTQTGSQVLNLLAGPPSPPPKGLNWQPPRIRLRLTPWAPEVTPTRQKMKMGFLELACRGGSERSSCIW